MQPWITFLQHWRHFLAAVGYFTALRRVTVGRTGYTLQDWVTFLQQRATFCSTEVTIELRTLVAALGPLFRRTVSFLATLYHLLQHRVTFLQH